MDIAISKFYKSGRYDLDFKNYVSKEGDRLRSNTLVEIYKGFNKDSLIIYIEDDWEGCTALTFQTDIQIVGDDITITKSRCIQCTYFICAHNLDKSKGWGTMVSHRFSDFFMADLLISVSTGQIKAGAPCISDRLFNYNQLLLIKEEFG
ncbi:ENO [Lepeophtheirus salmonis]|uniref:phosphopyruvate hydratase n=1 Tax=Lepeophtheirus salmonis TaxID=72036 RepID=A0A7R8CIE7_LEPSM|nr:ENO [Lepeophtheirus salmonis]CAF2831682.1 ENO [Lepeophtheirus salmonis]